MRARYQAMKSSEAESEFLQRRWHLVPQGQLTGATTLERLLEAQSRRASAEAAFIDAQIRYVVSLTTLKIVTGEAFRTMLSIEN